MDPGDTILDTQGEVKKLQDLVQKLEKQNEVLRTRQKLQIDSSLQNGENENVTNLTKITKNNSVTGKSQVINSRKKSEADIDDVIDFEKIALEEDEDSWLFSSPKPPTPSQSRVSPYKWTRQAFDNPSPEVESVKRSLIQRLDEAARLSRSSSTPAFNNLTAASPTKGIPTMTRSADNTPVQGYRSTDNTPTQGYQQVPKSRMSYGNRPVNTGTFTRPKKKAEATDNQHYIGKEDEQRRRNNSEGPDGRHPDVADIENLAKQQEESLRQSITNAHSSPRREERRHSQSNSIGSDVSSPPDSPYGSQYLNPNQENSNNSIRRSLPNVSRLSQPPGFHSSDPYLDNNSSGGSDDYDRSQPEPRQYSRIQQQNVRPSSPNVSGLRPPSTPVRRGLSPQRSGLPTPRRSIPRPGSAGIPGRSGIATPKRSGLPSPRSSAANRGPDDSWKEGCF